MQYWVFRVSRFVHIWGGITVALLILLISLSGSLLVWKNEIVLLSFPEAERVFVASPELYAELALRVETQFDKTQNAQITFPTAEFPLLKVTLSGARYAYMDVEGNLLAQWAGNERWEEWIYDLHHRILLDDLGLTIVGLLGMAMILLVIAGVICFWPLRASFAQGFWPQGASRARLLVSHRNIGILEALPFFMTLITAVILAFPMQSEIYLLDPFRGDDYSLDFNAGLDSTKGEISGEWLPSLQRSQASFPNAIIRSAVVPGGFSPHRIIGLQQAGELHPEGLSKVYINATEGWMGLRIDSQQQHLSERLYNTAYPLHTGRFGNLFYKILLTLSGLSVSILCLLSIISFVRKHSR